MADMRWTESQQDAIEARRGTVLVAAAAGSGKTAVLVQRAVERLTDREHPTPADRLLIVTFTKSAAAEMRARLERRLHELLREQPGDPHLRRQSLLLSQAHIGTVDSFCAEMVREHFHLLDLSPDFKIAADKQEEELTRTAVNQTVQEAFASGTADALADAFAGERDDRRLLEMVLTLYRFMQSHPFPERWLQEKVALYAPGESQEISLWERVILEYAQETLAHCDGLLARALEACGEDEKVEKAYRPALEQDRAVLSAWAASAAQEDWDGLSQAVPAFAPARRGVLRGYEGDPLKDRLEAVREEVKRCAKELGKCFSADRAACREEIRQTAPLAQGLQELVLDFSRRYQALKRERNLLDYSDLEHKAVQLFLGEDGKPTPTARQVAARFDEIMIDEFQDINEVQDSLFRAVSQGERNLFLVGDVKQSIYGFRRAMPEIFLRTRRAFQKYDRQRDQYPAYLVLDRNFRSRKEVTDTVNFVFSRLMSRAAGDLDYTGEERLVCGADYAPKAGCETELQFIGRRGGVSPQEAEGAWIACRIRELVEGGFTVSDKEGERPARWGDFCILLRSANQYAQGYARELQERGVPARAAVTGGFFQAPEVQNVLSLLRVIDNPDQDISLLAVLMSPLYGFSPDDVARLRLEDRKVGVYVSLLQGAEREERCARVVGDIAQYRAVAATMPSDGFLGYLYEKTDMPALVLAMENGEERLLNLHLLERYAREYESSGYHGVAGFVRFLDRLRENDSDLQAAELSPEDNNAVQVMSIHKSKGLEFPVCIVAGCGRNFVTDQRADVLLHPELGLGVKLRDSRRSARFTTTAREAIALETARSSAAEELRILYVALTRAREKLLLVGSWEDPLRTAGRLAMELTEQGPSPYTVRRGKNAAQWLLLCALCHPDGEQLRREAGAPPGCVFWQDYTPWVVGWSDYVPARQEEAPPAEAPQPPDRALYQRLQQQVEFTYPHREAAALPAKVAASKLAAQRDGSREILLSRPAWLGAKGMTPAQRGTALHAFLQFADYRAFLQDPAGERDRLVDLALLTPEQGEAVDLSRVERFLRSPLGQRILRSPQVERERRFTAVIPAALAEPEFSGPGEEVILQGAVDCTFVEEGVLHLVDFKTDRVENMETLWDRYGTQLRLYGYAMEEVSGLPVGELILYSTALNRASMRPWADFH